MSSVKHIEDDFLLVDAEVLEEEKNHFDPHSDDALSGWSELSAPSITSLSTISMERIPSATSHRANSTGTFEMVSNASGVRSMATNVASHDAGLMNNNTSLGGGRTAAIASTGEMISHGDAASAASVGSRVPFSWAEITKIQPTFQKPSNPDGLGNVPTPPPELRPVRAKKKKLDDIPELDLYTTKEEVGRDARRPGKKGARVKYPAGRRGSRRNPRRKK